MGSLVKTVEQQAVPIKGIRIKRTAEELQESKHDQKCSVATSQVHDDLEVTKH
jgi:hypothetical protein